MTSIWHPLPFLAASPGSPLSLPEGPVWQVWVLERPWPTAIALALFGLIAAYLFFRRGQPRVGWGLGGALLAAAAGVVVAGSLITTDREAVMAASRAFVTAALRTDEAGVERQLSDGVSFSIGGHQSSEIAKGTILSAIHAFESDLEIRDFSITNLEAADLGRGVVRSQVSVFVSPKDWFPGTSWWRFDWRKNAHGDWQVESIDCLSLNGQPPGAQLAVEILKRAR